MNAYYTVVIPWVPGAFATEWHPQIEGDELTRGAFGSMGAAIDWARRKLCGTPYTIKLIPAIEDDACDECGATYYGHAEHCSLNPANIVG